MLDHFSHSELACPTTDQVRLAAGFGEALEKLRIKFDAPIYLNSACRSPLHNAKIDGHPRSLHLYDGRQPALRFLSHDASLMSWLMRIHPR